MIFVVVVIVFMKFVAGCKSLWLLASVEVFIDLKRLYNFYNWLKLFICGCTGLKVFLVVYESWYRFIRVSDCPCGFPQIYVWVWTYTKLIWFTKKHVELWRIIHLLRTYPLNHIPSEFVISFKSIVDTLETLFFLHFFLSWWAMLYFWDSMIYRAIAFRTLRNAQFRREEFFVIRSNLLYLSQVAFIYFVCG